MSEQLHNEIMRAVGRIEGKIDGINQRLDTLNGSQLKQDEKINKLETFTDQLKGKILVIASVAGVVVSALATWIFKRI